MENEWNLIKIKKDVFIMRICSVYNVYQSHIQHSPIAFYIHGLHTHTPKQTRMRKIRGVHYNVTYH
jgi:hypothetical protein